ncbi:MAG: diaminopimelate epimerase [Deltaproteobacteria bacterium]|nr:diaminopimelate epimerase [Deltaproteobacteria bacterium]
MLLEFAKLHGLGNDFVVVDARPDGAPQGRWPALASQVQVALVQKLCDRHTGIGADGVLLWSGTLAAPRMTVINADGSEPEMCGNGLRCFVKYLADLQGARGDVLAVETGAGLRTCQLIRGADGKVAEVAIDMGQADWSPAAVHLDRPAAMIAEPWQVAGHTFELSALSMGNPHAVTFAELDAPARHALGPQIANHPAFLQQTNVEFVRAVGTGDGLRLEVDVFERGCGWTQACGTGATAVAFEALRRGLTQRNREVTVVLPGGPLHIAIGSDDRAVMRGPAQLVYTGSLDLAPWLAGGVP